MRRRFFLVTNPAAGIGDFPLIEGVVTFLERGGALVARAPHCGLAEARAAARDAAASGGFDAIIAAGGDGTIRQVACALIGSSTPLGIIPVGTGNVLAREIGLTISPASLAATLSAGRRVGVPCAEANGEPFLLMAGVGFDARVLTDLDQGWKSRVGKLAYAGPVLAALARPLDQLRVVVDGRPYSACWAIIANARHYAGRFLLTRRAAIGRRGLEAVLFRARSRHALAAQLLDLATGRLDRRVARTADVAIVSCRKATITSREAVPTQLDGDLFGTTPLEVTAGSAEVGLIVPDQDERKRSAD
jgi:diacylglycerol kinase family enzyme